MKKTRNCASGWWVVLLTATLAVSVLADVGVGLYNARLSQVTTSSTLKWSSFRREFMNNYVIGATSPQGPILLCRARHEGDMLLGQLRPDYTSCAVSGSKSYDAFEVLENIENASLITWKPWVKFQAKPNGGVVVYSAVDSVFIGRKKSEPDSGFSHNIGRISYESAIGHLYTFDAKNNDLVEGSGEVLVELEPVSYALEDVELDLNTQHVRQSDPLVIEERVLQNTGEEAVTVTTDIGYKFNYSLSWGHGHGIAIGLNTVVKMAGGTEYPPIGWSTPYNEEKKELYTLQKYLEPGTACNVTFRGNQTDRDVQYYGKLTTYYSDNESRSRQMRGERIENTLEVEAIYGEVYFVGNNSLVPTTTTTTTTTTTSTTTPPPETVPPAPEENEISVENKPESIEIQNDSSEGLKAPAEQNIKSAVAGGLGSKQQSNGATATVITFTIVIPMLALIL